MFPKCPAYKNLALAFLASMSLQIAIAQTNTWDGSAADNNWFTAANWSLNTVPTVNQNLVIPIDAAITIGSSLPALFKSLTVSNNAQVSFIAANANRAISLQNNGVALDIQAGSSLTLVGGAGNLLMRIIYRGTANIGNIAGTLIVGTPTTVGGFNTTGSITTVSGLVKQVNGVIGATSPTNMVIANGGTFEYAMNGGALPDITWDFDSNLNLTAITNRLPTGFGQAFGNIHFQSTFTQALAINADVFTQGNFTISNGGTFPLLLSNLSTATTLFVSGNFVLNSSAFTLVGNFGDANLEIGGNLIVNAGTFDAKRSIGNATINVGSDLEIHGGTFNLNGTGVTGVSTINVFQHFVQTAGLFNMNSIANNFGTMNIGGDFTQTGGSLTENASGTSHGQINFNGFIQNFTKSGTTPAGAIINYNVNENATLQFADNSLVTGAGTFSTQINSTLGIKHPGGISVTGLTGQVRVTGTRTYAAGTNYIYNGTANQVTGNGLTQNTPAFVTIENPGNNVTLSEPTEISADLTITSGNFVLNNQDFTLGGGFYNNDNFTPGTGKVVMNGAGEQIIGGTSVTTFSILEFAKTSGSGLLAQDVNVSNTLNIDVILDLASFNLTMGNTAQAIGTLTGTFDETKMIVSTGGGQLRKSATNASQATYGFPIGDIDGTPEFSPAGILFTGGTYNGWVGVNVFNQKHPNNGNTTDYLNRYWTVDQTGFSGFTANVGFNFVPADVVGTETQVRLGQWEGNEPWTRYDPSLNEPLNALTATVTEFSDFTGLSISEALPIHFGSIRGWAVNNSSIAIEWKILGETGTSHYEVERLIGPNNFAKIGSENASNSGLDETYTHTDPNPGSGDNFYRIKGIELTGEITYSPVVKVKLNGSSVREMKIYPNPIRNSNLAVSLQNFKSGKYEVLISNNNGQVIYSSRINQDGANTMLNISLNPTLSKGIYRLKITNGEDIYLSSFVKE